MLRRRVRIKIDPIEDLSAFEEWKLHVLTGKRARYFREMSCGCVLLPNRWIIYDGALCAENIHGIDHNRKWKERQ